MTDRDANINCMRDCTRCRRSLSIDSFDANHRRKDGLQIWCRECNQAYRRDRYANRSAAPDQKADTKPCRVCGKDQPISQFNKDRWTSDGLGYECKTCSRAKNRRLYAANPSAGRLRAKEWRESNQEKHRAITRRCLVRRLYGISVEDFDRMVVEQSGLCLICHRNPYPKKLHVDHDHSSGKVRGLLCGHCNSLLGMAKDNTSILASAIAYLEAYAHEEDPTGT